jgi:hypothetical protein
MDWKKFLGYFLNPILWIAVAVIAGGVFVYRKFFRDQSKDGFDPSHGGGKNYTLPDHAYATISERLESAMYGFGTDEDALWELLKGLTNDDLIRVYNEFGLRKPEGKRLGGLGWSEERKDLIDWFKDELSGDDLSRMEKIWKGTGLWR